MPGDTTRDFQRRIRDLAKYHAKVGCQNKSFRFEEFDEKIGYRPDVTWFHKGNNARDIYAIFEFEGSQKGKGTKGRKLIIGGLALANALALKYDVSPYFFYIVRDKDRTLFKGRKKLFEKYYRPKIRINIVSVPDFDKEGTEKVAKSIRQKLGH